jgi:ApbE superfamily uncharacterized protein (UPF0280 family)
LEYTRRVYRYWHRQDDLAHFNITCRETDLDIGIQREKLTSDLISQTRDLVRHERARLEEYLVRDPGFLSSLEPYQALPGAPDIARSMAVAAGKAGVGPMAAVAGAFAELVGRWLTKFSGDVAVENGGDIYLRTGKKRRIGVFAARSPFSNRIALLIKPHQTPLGICTSSGSVGHSLSFGQADAMVVLAPSVILADAVATASANLVKTPADLEKAVNYALGIAGVTGALAIMGDRLAVRGEVELVPS